MTYTYVEMGVSPETWSEVARKLKQAGYDHAFHEEGRLDMHGLALVKGEQDSAGDHGLSNTAEAWSVLCMLREIIENLAPPGSVPNGEYLTPTFAAEGEALLCGIRALADQRCCCSPGPDPFPTIVVKRDRK